MRSKGVGYSNRNTHTVKYTALTLTKEKESIFHISVLKSADLNREIAHLSSTWFVIRSIYSMKKKSVRKIDGDKKWIRIKYHRHFILDEITFDTIQLAQITPFLSHLRTQSIRKISIIVYSVQLNYFQTIYKAFFLSNTISKRANKYSIR